MLARAHRLTEARHFGAAIRRGRRAGSTTLVLHLSTGEEGERSGPRVGFIVSKAVGGAVVRNRVKRRLRHLVRERLSLLPETARLVVRAQPAAAAAPSARLAADLDAGLRRLLRSGGGQ